MEFTYDGYRRLVDLLRSNKYAITNYHEWESHDKCVILRHDIDYDISKALRFAEVEKEMGVASTFFVLVTSDFYNIFSKKNSDMLKNILELGHEIGLHFD